MREIIMSMNVAGAEYPRLARTDPQSGYGNLCFPIARQVGINHR
jgi:hypothetical protein